MRVSCSKAPHFIQLFGIDPLITFLYVIEIDLETFLCMWRLRIQSLKNQWIIFALFSFVWTFLKKLTVILTIITKLVFRRFVQRVIGLFKSAETRYNFLVCC